MNYWLMAKNVFCEVTVIFDHQTLISSSMSPSKHSSQIWRNSLKLHHNPLTQNYKSSFYSLVRASVCTFVNYSCHFQIFCPGNTLSTVPQSDSQIADEHRSWWRNLPFALRNVTQGLCHSMNESPLSTGQGGGKFHLCSVRDRKE